MARANLRHDAAHCALPFVLRLHHPLQRIEGRESLTTARDQECELADRLEGTARDHDDRDDRAHRHLAFLEAIKAADEKADADRLLRDAREVDGDRGELAHALARRGAHPGVTAPAAEHLPFGTRGLERFRSGDQFDQHRMLETGVGLSIERRAPHRPLQAHSGGEHHRNAEQRHEDEPAADQGDESEKQEHEREIDCQNDGRRREEVPHQLIFRNAFRHRSGAALAVRHGQVHDFFEELLRKLGVELAADLVDQAGSRHPEREIEDQRQQHAEGEHPQGRHRLVRDHSVVNVHREQRHREGEQVHHQRGQQHRPELAPLLPDFRPEPVPSLGLVPRPLVLPLPGRIGFDDDRPTGERGLDFLELDPHRLGDARSVDKTVPVAAIEEHRGAIVLELQDRRAFARRPGAQPAGNGLAAHADMFERRFELMERQPPISRQRDSGAKQNRR